MMANELVLQHKSLSPQQCFYFLLQSIDECLQGFSGLILGWWATMDPLSGLYSFFRNC